jgi:RNA polymerase sigma factor for flagellar operon FliA
MATLAANKYREVAEQGERDGLILEHLWLVRHVLGRLRAYLPGRVDEENLESAGVLGLVAAANSFDPARGVQFKTYAYLRIRGAILDELRRNCPFPHQMVQMIVKVRRAMNALAAPCSLEQLERETGLSRDQVLDCLAALRVLDGAPGDESMGALSRLVDHRTQGPEDAALEAERRKILAEAIQALPDRERLVVTLYFLEDLRLKEIGQVLNRSESRVSRLLNAALFRIEQFIRARER